LVGIIIKSSKSNKKTEDSSEGNLLEKIKALIIVSQQFPLK
jgi:hypothetical protein